MFWKQEAADSESLRADEATGGAAEARHAARVAQARCAAAEARAAELASAAAAAEQRAAAAEAATADAATRARQAEQAAAAALAAAAAAVQDRDGAQVRRLRCCYGHLIISLKQDMLVLGAGHAASLSAFLCHEGNPQRLYDHRTLQALMFDRRP